VKTLAEEARRDAAEADRKVATGQALGPLHGVPFTIKENIDVAGFPTTWGVPAFAGAIPPVDAPVVQRMRAAGAIAIGRTNLPDMGLRMHTDSSLHGLTRNPWNPARTASGSSGGDAVALATGMSALGLGNDIGGSLRNPASACGVASIRPSQGRVPHAGFIPTEDTLLAVQLMRTNGPMARQVGDVRVALSVLAGAHPRDPWSIDTPLDRPRDAVTMRVAIVAEPPGGPTDPTVAKVVRDAGAALRDAGYEVVEIAPPRYEEIAACFGQFLIGDFRSVLDQLEPIMGKDGARRRSLSFFPRRRMASVGMTSVDSIGQSEIDTAAVTLFPDRTRRLAPMSTRNPCSSTCAIVFVAMLLVPSVWADSPAISARRLPSSWKSQDP
jgi:amidase